jgi:hypothetical protein
MRSLEDYTVYLPSPPTDAGSKEVAQTSVRVTALRPAVAT